MDQVIIITFHVPRSNQSLQITATFIRSPIQPWPKLLFWSSQFKPKTGSVRFKGEANRSTPLNSTGRSNILSQLKQLISFSYKYSTSMLRLISNNQIVSLYFYNNKKQTTFVNSLCHFKPIVNHVRHFTLTYTSYFLSLLFVN